MATPDRMLHLHAVVRRRARGRARRSKRRDRAGRGGRVSAHITQRILSGSLLAFHDTIIISSPLFFSPSSVLNRCDPNSNREEKRKMESVYRSVVATLSGDNFYVDCKGATISMDDFLETASRDGYYLVSTSPFKLFPSPIEIAPQQQK